MTKKYDETKLLARGEALIREWFPNAYSDGDDMVVGDLTGVPGDSLAIQKVTLWWRYRDTPGPSGIGPLSLRAAMLDMSEDDAARDLGLVEFNQGAANDAAAPDLEEPTRRNGHDHGPDALNGSAGHAADFAPADDPSAPAEPPADPEARTPDPVETPVPPIPAGPALMPEDVARAAFYDESTPNTGDRETYTVADFYLYLPQANYMVVPLREMWPGKSVNLACEAPTHEDGQPITKKVPKKGKGGEIEFEDLPMSPTEYIDKNRQIDQLTWDPEKPLVIRNQTVADGGYFERTGAAIFNLYRAPRIEPGNANDVDPWLDHIKGLYGEHWLHIVKWCAHRVQKPGEKINHALVLAGNHGGGKDTILVPLEYAVGVWNFANIGPPVLKGEFNGYMRRVVLLINEARDEGGMDRFQFYEKTKTMIATPPETVQINEKHLREYYCRNVVGVAITTNHRTDGLYLLREDRRHFVVWSDKGSTDYPDTYFPNLYRWYANGGTRNVAAYLRRFDLTGFNPKADPPKTAAFLEMADSNVSNEDSLIADTLDYMARDREKQGKPFEALTIADVRLNATTDELRQYLKDTAKRKGIARRLQTCGWTRIANPDDKHDGNWIIGNSRVAVYAKKNMSDRERLAAAQRLRAESAPK